MLKVDTIHEVRIAHFVKEKGIREIARDFNLSRNTVAESFFGSLKTERVFYANYKIREDARKDIIDYIEMFYNSRRRHSYLGYISPREFEEIYQLKKVA